MFGVKYCGKQIESGSALSVLLIDNDIRRHSGQNLLWTHETHNILTNVMTNIVVDKSTDNAEPLSIVKYNDKKTGTSNALSVIYNCTSEKTWKMTCLEDWHSSDKLTKPTQFIKDFRKIEKDLKTK